MPDLTLLLICHAPTRATRRAAFPADEPLDAPGLAMAEAAAASIRRVDAAFTSPARRARQTASALRLVATTDDALCDLDYGRWAGRTLDDVAATDPAGAAAWLADTAAAPHGGEPIDALLARVAAWLAAMAGCEGRVVAVTHASVIRAALVTVLDAKPASFWRIDVAPLCRARLCGASGRWTLVSIGAIGLEGRPGRGSAPGPRQGQKPLEPFT